MSSIARHTVMYLSEWPTASTGQVLCFLRTVSRIRQVLEGDQVVESLRRWRYHVFLKVLEKV
jgi:hypothetical protein